jgi:hypothetical protein
MRALLIAMERQKRASAAKVQELACIVRDLQMPLLTWQSSASA